MKPIQCFILVYLLLFKSTSELQILPTVPVVSLLAVYLQTQTVHLTDENRERDAKERIKVANMALLWRDELEKNKRLLLEEKKKKKKKAKKEQNGFFHPLLALQDLKEKAVCPKRLSTKILLQRKGRKRGKKLHNVGGSRCAFTEKPVRKNSRKLQAGPRDRQVWKRGTASLQKP